MWPQMLALLPISPWPWARSLTLVDLSFLICKMGIVTVLCHSFVVRIKQGLWNENMCAQKTCTQLFITALCVIAKYWRQAKNPPIYEGINKLCYIHIMEYYSATKRIELLIHITAWMNLNIISERSQAIKQNKTTYCLISFVKHSRKCKFCDRKHICGLPGDSTGG